jgi:hypothetical protein
MSKGDFLSIGYHFSINHYLDFETISLFSLVVVYGFCKYKTIKCIKARSLVTYNRASYNNAPCHRLTITCSLTGVLVGYVVLILLQS